MNKKRILFVFFSLLYTLFLYKADLYSNYPSESKVASCCSNEEEDNCCSNESSGKCKSDICCHISFSHAPLTLSTTENKIEISSLSSISKLISNHSYHFDNTHFDIARLYSVFVHRNASKKNSIPIGIHSNYLSYINIWRC